MVAGVEEEVLAAPVGAVELGAIALICSTIAMKTAAGDMSVFLNTLR